MNTTMATIARRACIVPRSWAAFAFADMAILGSPSGSVCVGMPSSHGAPRSDSSFFLDPVLFMDPPLRVAICCAPRLDFGDSS